MKVIHFETIINVIPGRKSIFGQTRKRTRAIALCDHWVSPRKATKDWIQVTCKLCLRRKQ